LQQFTIIYWSVSRVFFPHFWCNIQHA
jgi:hypothetical protein